MEDSDHRGRFPSVAWFGIEDVEQDATCVLMRWVQALVVAVEGPVNVAYWGVVTEIPVPVIVGVISGHQDWKETCIRTHTHMHKDIHIHASGHTNMCIRTHAYMHQDIHIYALGHTHTCIRTYAYVHQDMFTCVTSLYDRVVVTHTP